MKKSILLLSVLLAGFNFYAAEKEKISGSALVIFNPDLENITGSEQTWLPGSVRDKLEEDIRSAGDFQIVDNSNERKIKELQKKSESAFYSEETAIEVGRLTSAKYAVFSTVRKAGYSYTVSLSFTNLSTGEKAASVVSSNYKEINSLFSGTSSAVDEVTLKLFDQLGISISAARRYILKHGDKDLTVEEQLILSQKEEENFQTLLKNFDKEIKNVSYSTELSATAKAAKLKAERALTEEKLKASQEQTKRLEELAAQKAKDALEDAARTEEQVKKRDLIAQTASEKAALVRAKKLEGESAIGQIKIVENKKRALLEIRGSVDERVNEINAAAEKEYEEKKSAIESAKYRAVELSDGMPTIEAVRERAKRIEAQRTKINSQTAAEISSLNNTISQQESDLLSEIRYDQAAMKKTRTVSSLSDELKVSVGAYDGKNHCWTAYIYYQPDGILLLQDKFKLDYSDLTGKQPVSSSSADFDRYADEVDLYNSWFSRGDLIYTYELDYSVEAMPDSSPSEYRINFTALRVKETIKDKVVAKPSLTTSYRLYSSQPVYDIRSKSELQAIKIASQKEVEAAEKKQQAEIEQQEKQRQEELEKQQKKQKQAEIKFAYKKENSWAFQTMGNGSRTMIGIYGGWQNTKTGVFDLDFSYGWIPWSYLTFGISFHSASDEVREIVNTSYCFQSEFYLGAGLNFRGHLGTLHPNFFVQGALGVTSLEKDEKFKSEKKKSFFEYSKSNKNYGRQFIARLSAGVDIPFNQLFALSFEYTLDYIPGWETSHSVKAGLLFTIP